MNPSLYGLPLVVVFLKNATKQVSSKKLATCRAGEFIDIMGLKGFQMDQVRVSPYTPTLWKIEVELITQIWLRPLLLLRKS